MIHIHFLCISIKITLLFAKFNVSGGDRTSCVSHEVSGHRSEVVNGWPVRGVANTWTDQSDH